MKKAIVVFTKVPKAGEVKTRLTTEESENGVLTYEEASSLYESILLDVIDVCAHIDEAELWICHNKEGDRNYLDLLLKDIKSPDKITGIFSDQGGSFDDCMQYAADYILKSGSEKRLADAVLIVGGDLPSLQPIVLYDALTKLDKLAYSKKGKEAAVKVVENNKSQIGASIVEGACQEGGFSIVGLTCTTPFDFHSVFYNEDGITALDMLVVKCEQKNIPFGITEMVPDVDIPVDLASALPVLRSIQTAAIHDASVTVPERTLKYLDAMGFQVCTQPPER